MKTIVTVWYRLYSLEGGEVVEGPTPEVMEIDHSIDSSPWTIKKLAAMSFENESENATVYDVDLGDTTGA